MRTITRDRLVNHLDKGEKIILEKAPQLFRDKSQLIVTYYAITAQIERTSLFFKGL